VFLVVYMLLGSNTRFVKKVNQVRGRKEGRGRCESNAKTKKGNDDGPSWTFCGFLLRRCKSKDKGKVQEGQLTPRYERNTVGILEKTISTLPARPGSLTDKQEDGTGKGGGGTNKTNSGAHSGRTRFRSEGSGWDRGLGKSEKKRASRKPSSSNPTGSKNRAKHGGLGNTRKGGDEKKRFNYC